MNYDLKPSTKISGSIFTGWSQIINELVNTESRTISIDMYVGIYEDEIYKALKVIDSALVIRTRDLFKSEDEVKKMTERFITDDVLFGFRTNLSLIDYFDPAKLASAKELIHNSEKYIFVVGSGASIVTEGEGILAFADMSRWEILTRFRKKRVKGLGIDNSNEDYSLQYKRGYFNDWPICDLYKDKLFDNVDYWLDTHIENQPKLIDKITFNKGIEATIKKPFRVVPFFAPAPWGGQWMKEKFNLPKDEINYGWCFDCVPEENSLLFDVDGVLFEIPSVDLVLLKCKELLGAPVVSRFGKEFPIRFDLLDTIKGKSLSFQVHPTTQFVRENFGMQYTQDESYYMIDACEDATVYLGLKNNIDKEEMLSDLRKAEKGEINFDPDKYANKLSAKKHDHFLIPAGTVHCSGPQGLVLEISSTPNLFTFKLWDWGSLDLDGRPRPVNVERGSKVIEWERDTDYTHRNLVNVCTPIGSGDGWMEEKTGLHPNEFIETRRHKFSKKVYHQTCNSVNVLNLVEGQEVIVESINGSFEPFVVHYAETFIIPAHLGEYTITPYGKSEGKECITMKAFVRFNA